MDILGELTGKEKDFKLAKYFMTNYGKYDETANHHPFAPPNSWTFDIEELKKTVTITCDKKTGIVTETQIELIIEQKEEFNLEDYDVINPMKMGM